MAGGREFEGGKFKELVLHLSQESEKAGDQGFGMVKLNKLLYRSDFEAFRLLGKSITGATYEKQDYGPVARELPRSLDELAARGYVVWHHYAKGPYTRDVPSAEEPADLSLFSAEELAVVARALHELAVFGARDVSEWSHEESAGWRVAEVGDEIPYETSIISSAKPSPKAVEQLRQRVLTNNWD